MTKKRDPTEWMTALVLGAAMLAPKREETDWHIMSSPTGNDYMIGPILAETTVFRLYQVRLPDDQMGVLQIATDPEYNVQVANNATILRILETSIAELEDELLHEVDIRNFIPRIVESFHSEHAGGRHVNIFAYSDVLDELKELIPVSRYVSEGNRLDPKSASWIIGKLLKVLVFAHSCGVTNGAIIAGNVLLEPIMHGLIVLDWSQGIYFPDGVPGDNIDEELTAVADLGMLMLQGDLATYNIPDSDQFTGNQHIIFERFLADLAHGNFLHAKEAHTEFYAMITNFWGKTFHQFTTLPRNGDSDDATR